MAAEGHFGRKSPVLIKNYAEDLGYEYLCANNKEEFLKASEHFLTPEITDRPMLFEVFTDSKDESNALRIIRNLEADTKSTAKHLVKDILGQDNVTKIKKMLGK